MLSPSHAYAQGGNVRCRVCCYRCSPKEQVVIQSRLALGNTGRDPAADPQVACTLQAFLPSSSKSHLESLSPTCLFLLSSQFLAAKPPSA